MASKSEPPVLVTEPSSEIEYESHPRECDDALEFALRGGDTVWGENEEKRVLFKIDLVILPLLFFCAMIGFADSGAFGFAALFGLIKDMKLYTMQLVNGEETQNTDRYSFAAAIYNLGSAAGQYPVLYVAQFFSYGKALGITSMYGGTLAMLTLVCKDFRDIMALRFFYGFGYVTQPLIIIIAAMWWKTNEQPLRLGLAIGGAGVGNIIGTGIDFGAVDIGGAYAASPWKWIYIILGSATIGIGLIIFCLLPASPMKAWFLHERERTIAVRRLIENNTGIQTRKFKWNQLIEAFLDPQLWLLGVYAFSFSFCNNAIGSFIGFLVSSFGYTQRQSLLMSMPVSAIALVSMVSSGVLGSIFPRRRILIAMLFLLPGMLGYSLLWKGDRDNKAMLLGGLYISSTFFGALVQMYALLSGNIAGHTKKSAVNATVVMLSQLGGFSGPWAYHGDEASRGYPTGQIASLILLCVSEAAFAALWLNYYIRNKKKAGYREEHQELVGDPKTAFTDHTDIENRIFQYAT